MLYIITVKKYTSGIIQKEFIQDYCYTDFSVLKQHLKKQGFKKVRNEKYVYKKENRFDHDSHIVKTISVITSCHDGERLRGIKVS